MNDTERKRLHEILFWYVIKRLLKSTNPIKLYDFMESLSVIAECDTLVLRSCVQLVLMNDVHNRPRHAETVRLFSMAGMHVRDICKITNMSMSTYYKYKDAEDYITLCFNIRQYEAIHKVLLLLCSMTLGLERSIIE